MKIGHIVNKIPLVKQNKETDELIDSTTLLGVEIEVERYHKPYDLNHIYAGYWTAKKDDSLRNNGMEMVFAEPLSGADAISAVRWICKQAETCKWAISKLTGLHVHVDIRNLELEQFRNFCAVYSLTEPLIYHWIGRGRYENMFCLPWYMAETDLKTISRIVKEGEADPARARQFLESISKYSGCNINAVHKFGTAEFRMMETTFDAARIIDWLNILLSLKKYAMMEGVTPQTMCEKIKNHGAWAFAYGVFGHALTAKMWYENYNIDAIGQGMVTCDWFLDNVKDLKLKGLAPGVQLDWARIANLTEQSSAKTEHKGEHEGLKKWRDKNLNVRVSAEPGLKKKKPPEPMSFYSASLGVNIPMPVPEEPPAGWGLSISDESSSDWP